MIKVYAVRISDLSEKYLESVLARLPETRRRKLLQFRFLQDTLRSVAGDLLIRTVLTDILGRPVNELEFGLNTYGKPIFLGNDQVGFNVSHSGDWVVLAAGSSSQIGIDLEHIKRTDLELARRFYKEDEYRSIMNHRMEKQKLLRFFQIWTAKESCVKAIGKGLSIPLDSFSTVEDDAMAKERFIGGDLWYFQTYDIAEEYICTACSDRKDFCGEVGFFTMDSLVDNFLNMSVS